MKFADINEGIEYSENHTDVAVVTMPNRTAARAAIIEAHLTAESAGLRFDFTDTGDNSWDLWAWADGTEDMQWRVLLQEGAE